MKDTFIRNGGKIRQEQLGKLLGLELEKNAKLKEWYTKNVISANKMVSLCTKLDTVTHMVVCCSKRGFGYLMVVIRY